MNFQILIIMKVYCPSHKRPDAPLFSISKNLIIVIDHEEEIEEYKRINEPRGHQVVYINNNQRVMGARNWILDQDNDWSMQFDDDIVEFCVWNKETQTYDKTDFDYFIEETEKVVNEVDQTKTGMIGYRFISELKDNPLAFVNNFPIPYSKDYEKISNYTLWQCVVLNNKLLKSLNFKYEGWFADNNYFGEDMFIQYWCKDNKLDWITFNKITFKSLWNDWDNSTVWKGEEYRNLMLKYEYIWLLDKFKHNIEVSSEILKIINSFINNEKKLKVYNSIRNSLPLPIYVPSHRRPDAVLFSMTTGLNIVIQDEEDLKQYSKCKDRHNVIYNPELKGLLDVRNWILEQAEDWVFILDDDVLEIKEKNDNISLDDLLIKLHDILDQIDKNKVGIVGFNNCYNNESPQIYEEEEERRFKLFQSVILNAPLLKNKNFKYCGYPYDGENGQRAHCEDLDILYFCQSNDLLRIRINNLFFKFDNEHQTVAWDNKKYRERILLFSHFWLLDKYKDYSEIVRDMSRTIRYELDTLNYNSRDELYNEIVNEVSYETLNKDGKETKMKKMLIGGLVVLLMVEMFAGCPENSEEGEYPVNKQFWGRYNVTNANRTHIHFIISKDKFERYTTNDVGQIGLGSDCAARTDGNNLYVTMTMNEYDRQQSQSLQLQEYRIGYFEENKLILDNWPSRDITSSDTWTAVKVQE